MKTVTVANLTLSNPALLAPMAALTDRAFRRLLQEIGGAGLLFSEMVSSDAVARRNERTMAMIAPIPGHIPQVAQLFGADPPRFEEAIRVLEGESAWQGFDINMGCPVPKVTRRGGGVRLMGNPRLAAEIVRRVRRASDKLVSVKLRLGYQPDDLVRLIPALQAEGADMLTVHFRLKEDAYSDPSRWEYASRLRPLIQTVFAGNGDVRTVSDIRQRLEQVDAVLLGRGAVYDPFVFKDFHEGVDRRRHGLPWSGLLNGCPAFERLGELIETHYPPELQLSRFKHYFRYMVVGRPGSREYRKKLYDSGTMRQARRLLRGYFSQEREIRESLA